MSILIKRATRVRFWGLLLLLNSFVAPVAAQLVNSEWNTGNGDWNVATNWFPNDVPDNGGGITYDVEIGNRPIAAGAGVTFVPEDGTSDTMNNLTISGAADLFTNGNQVFVIGQTTVDGVGSTIRIDPHATPGTFSLDTNNLDLNNGAGIQMGGGIVNVDVLFEINAASLIQGYGTVNVGDFDGVVEEVLENSGFIRPTGNTAAPQTLTLETNGVDTIDLDGDTETGVVDVDNVSANVNADTTTLVIDGPLSDAFSGTLQIGQRDTVTFNDNFTMSGADVQMNGGTQTATMNGPADATNIQNSNFTVTGDAVITNDLTFAGAGNLVTINANSSLTLSGTVNLPPASFNFASSSAELIVTGIFNSVVVGDDFNWDGPGTATTTISGGGQMILNVDQVDTGNDTYGGTLNLNDNAEVSVNNTANEWTAAGTINKNNAGAATVSGDRVIVTGAVNVNAGTLDLPAVTTSATANVNVTGTLLFGSSTVLAGGTLTGPGLLRMEGTSSVSANTTVDVATFDWDGVGIGTTHTISAGAIFTINSPTFDNDGDMDDPINLAGNGSQLVVNGPTQWIMNSTLTANSAAAGTATIGGTSRLVLRGTTNVDGNTEITAPLTFDANSTTSIDAGFFLDGDAATTYSGGTITGLGTYFPGPSNTVTADSTISVANFDFDGGNWTVQNGAELTINVGDYEPAGAPNAFDLTITLNNATIDINTADAEFVMDGVLNSSASGVDQSLWTGEALDIGNDAGVLDADVNISGSQPTQFGSQVDFNSDADMNVTVDATAHFLDVVNFNSVNVGNNAEFTGSGEIIFSAGVNFNETTTLNFVGGTVDLDGADNVGDTINVDSPLTINADLMRSFGKANGGGGTNLLDINNNLSTGSLTVNLDSPTAEWTLNAQGVMNLVNDNAEATMLAGSDVNINGTLNVTGDVRSTARLDIAGIVNINTLGQPLRLAGGDENLDPNTIAGGTINGPGLLGADANKNLNGFGTINADLDFDGAADLFADNGILTLNGDILDVAVIGSLNSTGILNVTNPWNSSVAVTVVNQFGGEIRGGTITVDNANGIRGQGLVSAQVINNTRLVAAGFAVNPAPNTHVFETVANNNDWDGAAGSGFLVAEENQTLELRDVGAAFGFTGTVVANDGGRVFTNGFALDFNAGSSLNLTDGTFESTNSTNLGGTVTVNAGPTSTIIVENDRFLVFENGSSTTLNANLQLENNNINIDAGAMFSGTGALIVPDGSAIVADPGADIGVLLVNQGRFDPGGLVGVGIVDVDDFQQSATGDYFTEIEGALLNQLDRLDVAGVASLDGRLVVDLANMFDPVLGTTFDIITAASVAGEFHTVDYQNLPLGKTFHVDYLATSVRLTAVATPFFSADFDNDGDVDSTDLAIWQGAYNLNQLGDADGDNDSDGRDFMLWQQQYGNAPLMALTAASVAVPEPGSLILVCALVVLLPARLRCASPRG